MAVNNEQNEFEITGINVTPFVDVMLVLLIIFMVTATYIVKEAIEVELPQAAAGGETTAKTLALTVTKDGKVYLDGAQVSDEALIASVKESTAKMTDLQAVIGADKAATHGAVVHVLDLLKTLGITKFAIQIEKKP
ncbi:MAG: biopolymer transporter ExbD [Gammaproteobacteria bacterium]|nr:biopolymer transporter ExbD [Gammaproteobacteria bacterium]